MIKWRIRFEHFKRVSYSLFSVIILVFFWPFERDFCFRFIFKYIHPSMKLIVYFMRSPCERNGYKLTRINNFSFSFLKITELNSYFLFTNSTASWTHSFFSHNSLFLIWVFIWYFSSGTWLHLAKVILLFVLFVWYFFFFLNWQINLLINLI